MHPAAPLGRARATAKRLVGQLQALEERPIPGFVVASFRRFKEIDGKQLSFVIGGNMFISVLPLFIVGYAIVEAFNPNRTIAVVVIQRFRLQGNTAALVRQTFTSARSGQNVALSLSIVSLFVTGFSVATNIQTAYARAFRVTPLRGFKKFLRGGGWLFLMLAGMAFSLTLRYWSSTRPWWFLVAVLPLWVAVNFGFYLVTPRLLLDVPFRWRHLIPGAAICVVAFAVVLAVSSLLMRNWLEAYGRAYGAFGIALAFLSWIGIIAAFWVWIGAIAGVYWERFASVSERAEIETMSERRSESETESESEPEPAPIRRPEAS